MMKTDTLNLRRQSCFTETRKITFFGGSDQTSAGREEPSEPRASMTQIDF